MCDFCFYNDIDRFEDYKTFEKFDLQLDQKRSLKQDQNGLIVVDNNGSYLDCYFQILKCNACGTIWWFSTPDNAWRGFFMKEANAKNKIKEFRKSDQKKRFGCLVFILLIVLIVIVCSINN